MGVVEEYVYTKINGTTAKYYESLGYEIPKRVGYRNKNVIDDKTPVKVKVSDLKPNSMIRVHVTCDNDGCDNIVEMSYQTYTSSLHDGKHYCSKCAAKVLHTGENNPNWNPNKTQEEREYDNSRVGKEYSDFIKKVLTRDHFTCSKCGKTGGKLIVHHLYNYSEHKDKRLDVKNGVALCPECHQNFHMEYGYTNSTPEKYFEWLDKPMEELLDFNGDIVTAKQIICLETRKIYNRVPEFQEEYKIKSHSNIYHACNKSKTHYVSGVHIMWLKDYENTSEEEIEKIISNKKWIKGKKEL